MSCNCAFPESWRVLAILAHSRTVCVEKLCDAEGLEVVRKSYRFPTAKDRRRGMLRGTFFGPAKAVRELHNLEYLKLAGVPAIEGIRACVLRNTCGFVVECHLLTKASAGSNLQQMLQRGEMPAPKIWGAFGQSISRMHQVNFWHRGLAPRNVLVETTAPFHRWLDPAKSKIFSRNITSAARADDLLRFWNPLHKVVPAAHKAAFELAYGQDGVSDPANLWPAIPKAKRASTARVLHRDETRCEESLS